MACCTASEKPTFRNPETGAYSEYSAFSCKSLQPSNSRKSAKFSRHFKGHFSIGKVQVRILPGQPASPRLRENAPDSSRKARQWRAFAIWRPVSGLPISQHEDRIRKKSLANTANIPVFRRRGAETGFDHGLRGEVGSLLAACGKEIRRTAHRLVFAGRCSDLSGIPFERLRR
jgi:hypothetical protein